MNNPVSGESSASGQGPHIAFDRADVAIRRPGTFGNAWNLAGRGLAWQGAARPGFAWRGLEYGEARHGRARHGPAGSGPAWQGIWRGEAWQGEAWRCSARHGKELGLASQPANTKHTRNKVTTQH